MLLLLSMASPAWAQRFPFDRTFEVASAPVLDVTTVRGKIDVSVGQPGHITVAGMVTVRLALDSPTNAMDLGRAVALNPPVESDRTTVRLQPPSDPMQGRAVTVSYQVRVPPDTRVITSTDSGATTIRDVAGAVTVRTQSAAITLTALNGPADVTTGSGAVNVNGIGGALSVTTSSSGFTGRSLSGGLRLTTGSGSVDATFNGPGDVHVETGSSAIRLGMVHGGLKASTRSGRVIVTGVPTQAWELFTGSGSMELAVGPVDAMTVDVVTGSGSVTLEGADVQGSVSKRSVSGTIRGGGPIVRASTRSGSVVMKVTSSAGAPAPQTGE